jgi:hypothetical protein
VTPTQKAKARAAITDYCARAESHELRWHYTQARPFRGYGVAPEELHANDCSGYVSLVFNWSMHRTGVYLADPLGYHYSGWGYTGSLLAWLALHGKHAPASKYLVGDIALYGATAGMTEHTAVCSKRGNGVTSRWSSHGTEAGPRSVQLHYRPDLLSVYRHPALL